MPGVMTLCPLGQKAFTSSLAPPGQGRTSALSLHPGAEPVLAFPRPLGALKCAFHNRGRLRAPTVESFAPLSIAALASGFLIPNQTHYRYPEFPVMNKLPSVSASKLPSRKRNRNRMIVALLIGATIPAVFCTATLIFLQTTGMIRPFRVPTGTMSPAVQPGDQIYMEALTYRWSKPSRGDVVVLRADSIAGTDSGALWIKRLVGLPGDHVRISDGAIFVNDQRLPLHNNAGQIHYVNGPAGRYATSAQDMVLVPSNKYFVLGDNSAHSYDSRYWGFLPADAVIGRGVFCYWPPRHFGFIR